jgi:uncharacterized membrane protein YgcG
MKRYEPAERTQVSSWGRRLAICLLAALGVVAGAKPGRAEKPSELKQQGYVNDFGEYFDDASTDEIGDICRKFDEKTGDRLLIVTVHSTEGMGPGEFGEALRMQWIGVDELRERTMVVVVTGEGRVGFGYGSAIEAALTTAKMDSIVHAAIGVGGSNYGKKLAFLSQQLADAIEEGIAHPPVPPAGSRGSDASQGGVLAQVRERLSNPRNAGLAICAVFLAVVLLIGRVARRGRS